MQPPNECCSVDFADMCVNRRGDHEVEQRVTVTFGGAYTVRAAYPSYRSINLHLGIATASMLHFVCDLDDVVQRELRGCGYFDVSKVAHMHNLQVPSGTRVEYSALCRKKTDDSAPVLRVRVRTSTVLCNSEGQALSLDVLGEGCECCLQAYMCSPWAMHDRERAIVLVGVSLIATHMTVHHVPDAVVRTQLPLLKRRAGDDSDSENDDGVWEDIRA